MPLSPLTLPISWRHVARVLVCLVAVPAIAQSPTDPPPSDPVVEQLLLKARGGPAALGESLSMLTRASAFEAINQLLEEAAGDRLSTADQATVAGALDASQQFKLMSRPELSDESKAFLRGAVEAVRGRLADPKRLDQAIDRYVSGNNEAKIAAIRMLFQGGDASVARLTGAIVATPLDEGRRRDVLLKMALRLDRDSTTAAIEQVALYGDAGSRARALAALARLGTEEFFDQWLTVLAEPIIASESDPKSDASAGVGIAGAVLRRAGLAIPSRGAAIERLRQRLRESMDAAIESPREEGTAMVWLLTPDGDSVTAKPTTPLVAAYRGAADAAARLARVADDDPASLATQINAALAYQVVNDPDWGDASQFKSVRNQFFPAQADSNSFWTPQERDVLMLAMEQAVRSNNDAAAIGLIRWIAAMTPASMAPWWLDSGLATALTTTQLSSVSPIVHSVDHPHPMVRYEAAAAIAAWQPLRPFAGQSRVRDRWRQMSTLGRFPTAIVMETRPEVTQMWLRILSQSGFDGIAVTGLRELERVVALGGDLRLIVAKDEPVDAYATELIDAVRRVSVARDVPILIYSPPLPTEPVIAPEPVLTLEQIEDRAIMPDEYGVIGGIENLEGIIEVDLLAGDLDVDHTTRQSNDLETLGRTRWDGHSRHAGLIFYQPRARTSLDLVPLLLQSERLQHLPPPSVIDRQRFAKIGQEALTGL